MWSTITIHRGSVSSDFLESRHSSRHFRLGLLTLLLCPAAGGNEVNRQVQQDPVPVFKAGTSLVRVDVVVTDKNGVQVRDLTASDFEIEADGLRVPVRVASFIPVRVEPAEEPSQADAAATVRRVVAFYVSLPVVRVESPMQGFETTVSVGDKSRRVARMLDSFFKTQMLPTDLVAIARADSASIEMLADFGSDRQILETAGARAGEVSLDHAAIPLRTVVIPPSGFGGPGFADMSIVADYTTRVLLSVDRLISAMEGLPGRRLLFFVGSLRLRSSPRDPGRFEPAQRMAEAVIEHANRAEVTLFGIEPSGFDQGNTDDLAELANGTGGSVVGRTEMLGLNLGKILARNLGYYSIGYEPRDEANVTTQKIRVRVKRKGVQVSARPVAFPKASPSKP